MTEFARTPFAVLWSGGKDSCLALWRAREAGLYITALVNFYDGTTGRVRFHGVRATLIAEQARALGLELFQYPTTPDSFAGTFIEALHHLKARGYAGVVAGDIHLDDVRTWNEERASDAGLRLVEPLWLCEPSAILKDFVEAGFRALLTCASEQWSHILRPGREITEEFVADVSGIRGLDACGEHGEYHSFVFDGPLFSHAIICVPGELRRSNGFSQIDLTHETTLSMSVPPQTQ
jgi:uncharacterized protein (TIGR00290 family)